MSRFQIERKHSNIGLFALVVLIYVVLLLLFAWQTLLFVGILFPDTDLLMKVLTVFSVDGMGFVWACLHTFYRFAHPYAKKAVQIGWGITYLLSGIISVLYLILTYMFDFQHVTDLKTIQIGVGASIGALVFNLAMLSAFLYYEIATRFPNEDEFEVIERPKRTRQLSPHSPLAQSVGQSNRDLYDAWRDASIEERQAIMQSYTGTDVQGDASASPLAGTASLNSEGTMERPGKNGHQK